MRRPAAVLFDCDGVLADSEGLVNRIVAADLTARGWRLSAEQARETFLGMAAAGHAADDRGPGRPAAAALDRTTSRGRIAAAAAATRSRPVPGAIAAVRAVAAAGLAVAVASNSGRGGAGRRSWTRLGLAEAFGDRVFSFEDVARPKPAPDIYRAAAAACGAVPGDCVVVEDSLLGAQAGIAAGCRVLGFARETEASVLAAVGAVPFARMEDLPGLLGLQELAA